MPYVALKADAPYLGADSRSLPNSHSLMKEHRAEEHPATDRRHFLKRSASGLALGLAWPSFLSPVLQGSQAAPSSDASSVVVFQGDSVTDAGRNKEETRPNLPSALGPGYAGLSASQLLEAHPEADWQCYNRGISGHKVYQLAERWQDDALALEPDVLSILIGVNDFWHTLTQNYEGTTEIYERDYRALLDRTREALPGVKLIIGEPFALRGGSAVDDDWYPTFNAYQAAARRVADAYEAVWIPYQSVFDEALGAAPATYWSPDGVHPSAAGNALMAEAWLDAFEQVGG